MELSVCSKNANFDSNEPENTSEGAFDHPNPKNLRRSAPHVRKKMPQNNQTSEKVSSNRGQSLNESFLRVEKSVEKNPALRGKQRVAIYF